MISKEVLDVLNEVGCDSDADEYENYIKRLRNKANEGNPEVSDKRYDYLMRVLEIVKPESELLYSNWEKWDIELDERDYLLDKYGMMSIKTISDTSEIGWFISVLEETGVVDMTVTLKLNGHAIRAVYENGKYVSGTRRGRYKKGLDISRHLSLLLPSYVERWKDIELVEVRGEALVSYDNFENHFKGSRKNPLSSVTSIMRDGAYDDEIEKMDVVCYRLLKSEGMCNTQTDELIELNDTGFNIPVTMVIRNVYEGNLESYIDKALMHFEKKYKSGEMEYDSDGLVFSINDNEIFYNLPIKWGVRVGNFALKSGDIWGSGIYSSRIVEVVWESGKIYKTPKALIEPVIVSDGKEIETVPLYNVGVMQRYKYTSGGIIYFKVGGEKSVITCDMYGNSVKE